MYVRIGTGLAMLLGVTLAAALPQAAHAQWGVTTYGVAEYDTNEVLFTLLGASASPEGLGLKPVVSLQVYRLGFDAGTESRTIWSVRPAVGLKNSFQSGALQAKIGYSIQTEDVDVPEGIFVPDPSPESGFTASAQYDHWGTGGPLAAQLIGSYNFGSESLWARARASTRVASTAAGGQFRVGGEVAHLNSDNVSAWQPGGVVEWHLGGGPILIGGVGRRLYEDAEDATYFKFEFVLPVR